MPTSLRRLHQTLRTDPRIGPYDYFAETTRQKQVVNQTKIRSQQRTDLLFVLFIQPIDFHSVVILYQM